MAELFCHIGETIWRICCQEEAVLHHFSDVYGNFICQPATAHCTINITPGFVAGDYMSDHGVPVFKREEDKLWATHAGSYHGYYSLKEPVAYYTIARPAYCSHKICGPNTSISNIIRLMMMLWLPRYGRLLLHSASLLLEGKGYLFLGQSGYGKSTLANLFGQEALSGDLTLVGEKEGQLYIWPTFMDYMPQLSERHPTGYPLEKIFLLSGHQPYSLRPITSSAMGMKAILENCVGAGWQQAEDIISIAQRAARLCPPVRLTYLLENDGQDQKSYLRQLFLQGHL